MKAYDLFWKWTAVQSGLHTEDQPVRVCTMVWLEQREGFGSIGKQCWIRLGKSDYGGPYMLGGRFLIHKRKGD